MYNKMINIGTEQDIKAKMILSINFGICKITMAVKGYIVTGLLLNIKTKAAQYKNC